MHGGTLANYGTLNNKYQLFSDGTLTNNSGGMIINGWTMEIGAGATVTNKSGGTLDNSLQLNNYGTITNESGGTLKNHTMDNKGTLNNGGTLFNNIDLTNNFFGKLTNESGGTLYNIGTLTNKSYSPMQGVYGLTNDGTLNNESTLSAGGTLINDTKMGNYGTLNNKSGASLTNNGYGDLDNYGTLNNKSGASLTNNGILGNYGTLNNSGTLTGSGNYIQVCGQTINNGSLTQTSIAILGGSLSGTGTITGAVTIANGATIHPGDSPGTLTINGPFSSSGNLLFDIAGTASGQYSLLQINGAATFMGGNVEFDFINGYSAKAGDSWDFLFATTITGWGTLNFTIDGLGPGLGRWEIENYGNGGGLLITSSVPIPSTLALLGTGLLGLFGIRRRFKK